MIMKKYIGLLVLLSVTLMGCEDVIELDLDEGAPRIAIEGIVTDQPGPYTVTITESVGFYDDNVFPSISGAYVEISDDQGNVEVLAEKEAGVYQTASLQGQRGSNPP